jgi:hypothetical protein
MATPSPGAPHADPLPEYRLSPVARRTIEVTKRDGTRYAVVLDALGAPVYCTCPGFHFRGYCRHVAMVADAVVHRDIAVDLS